MARITRFLKRNKTNRSKSSGGFRLRGIESMEPRCVLSADPIDVGIVYLEQDAGADSDGDLFQLTFTGGAENTELNRIIIDGDQELDGFSIGDSFFDVSGSGLGADSHADFELGDDSGIDEVRATVADGGTQLILDFVGFNAGESLFFEIDVDEVEDFDTIETDIEFVNGGFDPITSGVEFQGSHFTAEFTAPHFFDISGTDIFRNQYDSRLDETALPLPRDDDNGQRDRSAAAFLVDLEQQPLPSSISGRVHLSDENGDCFGHEEDRRGVAGATVQLLNEAGDVLQTTVTDANGDYEFADLPPGDYGVREITPDGLFDGGAQPGTLDGMSRGEASGLGEIVSINLAGGEDVEDVSFCEHVGANLSGHVFHDRNNDGKRGDGEEAIAGVIITLIDADGNVAGETTTDINGFYEFVNIAAGEYSIIETQPTGFLDGIDTAGTILGSRVGAAFNPGDRISGVTLGWGQDGIDYDFGEFIGSSLSGRVQNSTRDGDCFGDEEDHDPVVGATVQLLDADDNVIAETVTDANGRYEFVGLAPGEYGIREVTPEGLLSADAQAGGADGETLGQVAEAEIIRGISLASDVDANGFDFCVHVPAMISGTVYHDANNDGIFDEGEEPIEGVIIELLDADGNVVATATTDENGFYKFGDILPGQYGLREIHPEEFIDGKDTPGTLDGETPTGTRGDDNDSIRMIDIGFGDMGEDFNFGELRPATIAGRVHSDIVLNCEFDPSEGDQLLGGVTVQLLDASGEVVAETVTDASGEYEFDRVAPGDYRIRQIQPEEFFDGNVAIGSEGGESDVANEIAVSVGSGDALTDYNFCETTPAELSGFVFQDGAPVELTEGDSLPERVAEVRDGQRTSDDRFLPNVAIELRDGISGLPVTAADATLPGLYPEGFVSTVTDANGFYSFEGLRPGSYAVFQAAQPDDLFDGVDTPGTTSGIVFNAGEEQQQAFFQLADGVDPQNDAIIRISLPPGTQSLENNFSEVAVNFTPLFIPPPAPPQFPFNPLLPVTPLPPGISLPQADVQPFVGTPPGRGGYSPQPTGGGDSIGKPRAWHLSIINGGNPRGDGVTIQHVTEEWFASTANPSQVATELNTGEWIMPNGYGDNSTSSSIAFGAYNAIPFAADFNGDGYDEIGVYINGEWFIDLDGDGKFDAGDLWAKLGSKVDIPVTGDWDGDGKADIGIFGREWLGDQEVIADEPGLPDAENETANAQKNIPPQESVDENLSLIHI